MVPDLRVRLDRLGVLAEGPEGRGLAADRGVRLGDGREHRRRTWPRHRVVRQLPDGLAVRLAECAAALSRREFPRVDCGRGAGRGVQFAEAGRGRQGRLGHRQAHLRGDQDSRTAQARRQRRLHRAGRPAGASESSRSRSPTGSAASRSAYGPGRSPNWVARNRSCSTSTTASRWIRSRR